jgi:DNA-binding LacI/PurR family transcriptional regulator
LLWIGLPEGRRAVARRIKPSRPDALVVSAHAIVEKLRSMNIALAPELPIINLHWLPTAPEIGGIDQSYDMIAANAVDLVVSQLNGNETGVPAIPRMLLFPGRWVEPGSLRSDKSQTGSRNDASTRATAGGAGSRR